MPSLKQCNTPVLRSKTMYREPLVPWGYWKTRTALAKVRVHGDANTPPSPPSMHSCMIGTPTRTFSGCQATARVWIRGGEDSLCNNNAVFTRGGR